MCPLKELCAPNHGHFIGLIPNILGVSSSKGGYVTSFFTIFFSRGGFLLSQFNSLQKWGMFADCISICKYIQFFCCCRKGVVLHLFADNISADALSLLHLCHLLLARSFHQVVYIVRNQSLQNSPINGTCIYATLFSREQVLSKALEFVGGVPAVSLVTVALLHTRFTFYSL